MSEYKPCPFCGASLASLGYTTGSEMFIRCNACGARAASAINKEYAVEAWQTRKHCNHDSKLRQEIRVLQKRLRDANRGAEKAAKMAFHHQRQNTDLIMKCIYLRIENKKLKGEPVDYSI